jgi:hypothetical protein
MPALAASARPMVARKGAVVPRCEKAPGVVAGLRMYKSPGFEWKKYHHLQVANPLSAPHLL